MRRSYRANRLDVDETVLDRLGTGTTTGVWDAGTAVPPRLRRLLFREADAARTAVTGLPVRFY
ncbi:hypothetical protein A2J03_13500 [Rhodococcus sp. EPR-157]|nr:hypothetical protein A2J03_13500 [Rhodococcus sp. EPR-157]